MQGNDQTATAGINIVGGGGDDDDPGESAVPEDAVTVRVKNTLIKTYRVTGER